MCKGCDKQVAEVHAAILKDQEPCEDCKEKQDAKNKSGDIKE